MCSICCFLIDCITVLTQAAIIKCNILVGLNDKHSFLTGLEAGTLRSWCNSRVLVRSLFQTADCPLLLLHLTRGKERDLWSLRCLVPFLRTPHSQPNYHLEPYFQTPSQCLNIEVIMQYIIFILYFSNIL